MTTTTHDAPAAVTAGGLLWSAAVDDQPLGSPIGWGLAVEIGTPADAELVDLRKAAGR